MLTGVVAATGANTIANLKRSQTQDQSNKASLAKFVAVTVRFAGLTLLQLTHLYKAEKARLLELNKNPVHQAKALALKLEKEVEELRKLEKRYCQAKRAGDNDAEVLGEQFYQLQVLHDYRTFAGDNKALQIAIGVLAFSFEASDAGSMDSVYDFKSAMAMAFGPGGDMTKLGFIKDDSVLHAPEVGVFIQHLAKARASSGITSKKADSIPVHVFMHAMQSTLAHSRELLSRGDVLRSRQGVLAWAINVLCMEVRTGWGRALRPHSRVARVAAPCRAFSARSPRPARSPSVPPTPSPWPGSGGSAAPPS